MFCCSVCKRGNVERTESGSSELCGGMKSFPSRKRIFQTFFFCFSLISCCFAAVHRYRGRWRTNLRSLEMDDKSELMFKSFFIIFHYAHRRLGVAFSLGQSLPLAVLTTLFERETQKLWRRRREAVENNLWLKKWKKMRKFSMDALHRTLRAHNSEQEQKFCVRLWRRRVGKWTVGELPHSTTFILGKYSAGKREYLMPLKKHLRSSGKRKEPSNKCQTFYQLSSAA